MLEQLYGCSDLSLNGLVTSSSNLILPIRLQEKRNSSNGAYGDILVIQTTLERLSFGGESFSLHAQFNGALSHFSPHSLSQFLSDSFQEYHCLKKSTKTIQSGLHIARKQMFLLLGLSVKGKKEQCYKSLESEHKRSIII